MLCHTVPGGIIQRDMPVAHTRKGASMTILELNAKACMSHLLLKPTFHRFSFISGEVTTYNTFHIDGHLHKDFYDQEPQQDYSSWKDVQEFFLSFIRGKRTPLNFRIILSLSGNDIEAFLSRYELSLRKEDVQGLYLNFRYDGEILQCITGTSMNTFTLDKSLEPAWDQYVHSFFAKTVEA